MKNINQWNLIPSLVVIGSCLAFSLVAQTQPVFHGNLTIRVDGPITASSGMAMGGMTMDGTASPTFSDSTALTFSTNAVVASATGDFAALGIKHGGALTLSTGTLSTATVMDMGGMGEMMMGTEEGFTFTANSGLSVSSDLLIFNSPAPNRLHVYAPVMVMDSAAPNYGMAYGELNGYFTSNEKGVITGYFTIYVPEVKW